MNTFLAELIGTAFIIIFGNGVVANVVLAKTKGFNSGWIVITFGWSIGVFAGVFIAANVSGAHLNPAVSVAMSVLGRTPLSDLPMYITAQLLGAMVGQIFVWLSYRSHYEHTEDQGTILATFSTMPAIDSKFNNFITETIATFVFVLAILHITGASASLGSLDALPVALLVLGMGLSLGGPTGYAINPARDLGPRIMHAILPIKNKGESGWNYAWIPVIGPIVGGVLAALVYVELS